MPISIYAEILRNKNDVPLSEERKEREII